MRRQKISSNNRARRIWQKYPSCIFARHCAHKVCRNRQKRNGGSGKTPENRRVRGNHHFSQSREFEVYMKSLFEPAVVGEIRNRMAHLRPDSERQWGKMNVAQMLAHCSAAIEMAEGK